MVLPRRYNCVDPRYVHMRHGCHFLVVGLLTTHLAAAQGAGPGLRAGLAALSQPVLMDTLARTYPVTSDRVGTFVAILAAYDSLGIPIDFKESSAGIVVAERLTVSRELKKVPLSRYVDCGQGFNGVNANVYRLTLVVATWIAPLSGAPASVKVAVAGSGMDMTGSNGHAVLCTSKGVLEDTIVQILRLRLAAQPSPVR